MNKDQKQAVVAELTDELKNAEAIFAIDYRGISVPQAAELRTGLRDADARFRVVKNRLTLRAADAAGTEEIKPHLTGPTALALVSGDVALAAKTLSRLGDEWELLSYKGGIMDGDELDADSFKAIAKLPGRDQLNAQFAGIVASPLTGLVRGLGSMVQGLALQLQAIADQGLVSGEAPSESSAAPTTASQPDTSAGEAEDVAGDGESSDPDPDPQESPEEAPSEEEAPGGESAEPATEGGGGEGDQDLGEEPGEDAEQTEPPSETSNESSDQESDEQKEDG